MGQNRCADTAAQRLQMLPQLLETCLSETRPVRLQNPFSQQDLPGTPGRPRSPSQVQTDAGARLPPGQCLSGAAANRQHHATAVRSGREVWTAPCAVCQSDLADPADCAAAGRSLH